MKLSRSFIIYSIFLVAFLCSPSFADNSEIITNNCYLIKMAGVKTGYSCTIQRRKTENGTRYIVTDMNYKQKIKRMNELVEITQDTNYVEEESGKPVSFSITSKSSGESFKISGSFKTPYEMSIDSDVNGLKTQKEIKFKDKIIFPYAIDNLYRYNDKNEISYSTIEPSIDLRAIKIKTEKQGLEDVTVDGLSHKYAKYKVSMNILPGMTSYEWRDRNGQVVKESVSLLKIEQILTKDKNEIANISGEGNYDLFSGSLISVNKPISDPDSLDQISYKIQVFDTPTSNLFLQDSRQKITLIKNNTVYLKIKSIKPETGADYPYPLQTKGFEEYLESGPFIMPDSDKISSVANSLVAGETDAYVISKKMENWVYNAITTKDYSFDFANAVEALETRTGDCTEHSVLLASLLRAAGIPSKVLVGLIYTNDPKPSFGYHMWVKAYIGKWIDLDATLPYKNFVATHIAMAESPLNSISDRADVLINILKSFSGLKIEVLSSDKSAITNLNNGVLKINIGSPASNDFLTIKTINNKIAATSTTGDGGIKTISLSGQGEQDFVRSAFYNFIKGDIQKSLNDFNTYYGMISPGDDFSYMKLGLKLSSLGFFNLASKSFNNVKDTDIWGLQINNAKNLYFPEKNYSPQDELLIANALSKIEFQNLPDDGASIINKNKLKFQNDDFAHYLLAKAYLGDNKADLAQNELKKAIKICPENLTYRMEQAKIYIQRNSYKSAERELILVKDCLDKSGVKDAAFIQDYNEQNYWLKFKQERGNPLKSKFYKAKYYEAKQEYNVALDILNELSTKNADKVAVYQTMGNIYTETDQPDKAKQSYVKTLQLDGDNVTALIGLGELAFSDGNSKEALEKYSKALGIEPNSSEIKLKLAEIYEVLGQEEKSYSYYRDVLQDSSMNLEANYNIGMMYLRTGDIDEAEKSLKKALSANPMYSLIWIDLAGLEITKGNYDLAASYLRPINYMDEKNPYYYYYLGLINKAQGDFSTARDNFDKAIDLKPDFDEVNKVLNRL